MSHRRPLSTLLTLVVAAAAYYFLAPAQLPLGSNYYVQTSGISMEPLYHAGALVIVRKQSFYKAGDIAAYRNKEMGNLVVLHRIKEVQDGHYVFKGDNNSFIDPVSLKPPYVTESDLVGTAWVHVPRAGAAMNWLQEPLHIAIILGVGFLLTFGGIGVARHRGSGDRRRSGRSEQ